MAVLKKTKNNAYNDVLNKIAAGTAPQVILSGFKLHKLPYDELLTYLATDKTVVGLDLSKNELGDEGAQAVAHLIRTNTHITSIDLRFNKITTLGASHLVTALQEHNFTVTSLLLQEDTKGLDATFSKLFNLTEIVPVIDFVCELNKGLASCRSARGPELRLCRRAFKQLPPILNDMGSHLVRLDLSQNSLTSVPPTFLTGFPVLEILFLNENKITSLPAEINKMGKLKKLSLAKNQLTVLPDSIALLEQLTDLDVDQNQLQELPSIMGSMKSLKKLKCSRNPFKGKNNRIPPEIIKEGDNAILSWLRNALLSGTEKLDTMKLMFVGNGNVGKTTLLKNFMAKKNELEVIRKERNVATDGIDIRRWVVDKDDESYGDPTAGRVVFRAWDFAGQDVYYSTHQFFLSPQAVYILVFNLMDSEENNRIEYWLHSIRSRARRAPIVLVGTHLDEAGVEKATAYLTKVNRFKAQNPNIKLSSAISLSTGDGVKELKDALVALARKQSWYMKEIPRNYLSVQRKLETFKQNRPEPLIDFKHFYRLCIDCEIPAQDIRAIVDYLINAGDIVYFKDRTCQLAEVVILDPEWLARMFATIITMKPNFVREGVLSLPSLRQLWSALHGATNSTLTPEQLQPMLLSLFQRFELLHYLNESEIIVPSLLPAERPPNTASVSWTDAFPGPCQELHRVYKMEFLPTCFFSRILVRLLIKGWTAVSYYRNGFYMSRGETAFVLDADKGVVRTMMKTRAPSFSFSESLLFSYSVPDMIEAWLPDVKVDVELPCALCSAEAQATEGGKPKAIANPLSQAGIEALGAVHTFAWEYIEDSFHARKPSVPCRVMENGKNRPVPLERLAPDITMHGIPRLEYAGFSEKQPLGKGSFATVWQGKYTDGTVYAVKQLVRGSDPSDAKPIVSWQKGCNGPDAPPGPILYEFRREARLMQAARHPNIVAMLGVCVAPLCIAMELMNAGSLDKYLRSPATGRLTWNVRLQLAMDIAHGMNFLHHSTPPIIHRDLKSPNVLLQRNAEGTLVAKVSDVGLAHSLEIQTELRARVVDNPTWLAPEVLLGASYTEKADVYSFGVILYELWAQKAYFAEEGSFWSAIERHVVAGRRPAMPGDMPQEYKIIVRACWHQQPRERATFDLALRELIALNAKWTAEPPVIPVIQEPVGERKNTTSENYSVANSLFDQSQAGSKSKGGGSGSGSKSQGNASRDRSSSLMGMSLGGSVSATYSRGSTAAGGASLQAVGSRDTGVSSISSASTNSLASTASLPAHSAAPHPAAAQGSNSLAPPEAKHRRDKEKKEKDKKEKEKKEKKDKK